MHQYDNSRVKVDRLQEGQEELLLGQEADDEPATTINRKCRLC